LRISCRAEAKRPPPFRFARFVREVWPIASREHYCASARDLIGPGAPVPSLRAATNSEARNSPELRTALRSDETEAQSDAFLAEHRSRYLAPYEARLRHLASRTREGGIEPVLITQPALYGDAIDPTTGVDLAPLDFYGRRASTAWKVLELYHDVTRRVASDTGVLLVDFARRMPKDSGLFYDWVHYTNAGAEKVAEIVADDLVPFLAAREAPAASPGPP